MPRKNKTAKPYPEFPLFHHATGQWAKKIKGRLFYFGVDPDSALKQYLDQKDDLHAGRPRRRQEDNVMVRDLCNEFLTAKKRQLDARELSPRSFRDYYRACDSLLKFFGRNWPVASLRPNDFERFRASLAKTRGPVALSSAITRARIVFKWAYDNEKLDRPVRFGTSFKKPAKKIIRKAKRESASRVFQACEVQ